MFLWNILRDDVLGHAITFWPPGISNTHWILFGKCPKLEVGIYLDSLFSITDIKETLAPISQILSITKSSEEMENTYSLKPQQSSNYSLRYYFRINAYKCWHDHNFVDESVRFCKEEKLAILYCRINSNLTTPVTFT